MDIERRTIAAKEKKISIKPKGITPKQYSALLLEINLMKRAWKPYGVDLQVSAPGLRNILKWGTNAYSRQIKQTSKSV